MPYFKKLGLIQWLAWFYALNFLFILIISHWPGLTDVQGRLLGLFPIDLADDIFHSLSGLLAAIVAMKSHTWSVNYFKYAGIPYGIDTIIGFFFSKGFGSPDFSMHNFLVNLPHIVILITMLWIGFWLSKRIQPLN